MATIVYGRGRWRVLCRAAADVLTCLQCRKHGLLLPTHSATSFLCSSSKAALKPECFHRERRTAATKEVPPVQQVGSGRGGDDGNLASSKRPKQRNSTVQPSPGHGNCAQECDRMRDFLKRRLQLELSRDRDSRDAFLLCCTLSDVEERVERLLAAGFTEEWAAILLPLFPPLWDVNITNMREVFTLLTERGFGGTCLKKLVSEHSYLLLEDRQLVERRLNELLDVGIEQQQIVAILTAYPMLLGFPLGRDTVHTIRELQEKSFGSRWVGSTLLHCLRFRPSRVSISPGIGSIMELLKEIGVEPDDIMIKCPSFFGLDASHLVGVVQVLCSRPLYLDARDMHHMIQSFPEVFIDLCAISLNKLQSHLDTLCKLFPSIVKLIEMLKKTPGVLSAIDCELGRKVLLLKELGFTTDQLSAFIAKMPGFIVQTPAQDMEQRMRLFFSIPDVSPQLLLQSPLFSRLLSRKWEFLQTRYSYANAHNVDVVKASFIQQLFWSTDDSFAQLCNRTLHHFHSELGPKRESYMEGEDTPPTPPPSSPHQTAVSKAAREVEREKVVSALVPIRPDSSHTRCYTGEEGRVDGHMPVLAHGPSPLDGEIPAAQVSDAESSTMSSVKQAPTFVFKPDGVPTKWRSRNYATYLKKKKGVLTFTCPVCGHVVGSESGYGKHIMKHGTAYAYETPPVEWNAQFTC